ncbi:hypothetical protein ITJ43_09355 [Microbacterium sp. VKM Ac-2870]|uniref:hypothetical protein n=1 Tax=Microbacterium sp. VKM Ac-2870 TaxID=2783825 RepID=UPI00188B31FC|nr:hypothetical protein [Microbacterium sp. VKM Ac-2870]MBF4562347.1 hypothetical protein [Microbacterium sp. VKM Ac-2870]
MSPNSIPTNPNDILQCDFFNNADHVVWTVDTWPREDFYGNLIWSGGDVDLLCGTDATSGYKHIRQRHQNPSPNFWNGWETVRASASAALGYESPQKWDEYMTHAVEDTLDYDPAPWVNNAEQKICFSAPFNIYKGSAIYASYYANTVVSKSNYVIITSFLSNQSQASACYDGW